MTAAIMAGKIELIERLFEKFSPTELDTKRLAKIFPFHLAAAFLDDGSTCCIVMLTLSKFLGSG